MDKCYYTDKYCYGFLNTCPLRNDSICSYFWFVKWSHPMESGGQPWAQWESCFPEEEVRPPERFSSHQLPRQHTWNGRLTWNCLKACWQPPPPDSACPNPRQWETSPAACEGPSWPPASPVHHSCSSPSRWSFSLKVSWCHSLIKTPTVLMLILNERPVIWPLLTSLAV